MLGRRQESGPRGGGYHADPERRRTAERMVRRGRSRNSGVQVERQRPPPQSSPLLTGVPRPAAHLAIRVDLSVEPHEAAWRGCVPLFVASDLLSGRHCGCPTAVVVQIAAFVERTDR